MIVAASCDARVARAPRCDAPKRTGARACVDAHRGDDLRGLNGEHVDARGNEPAIPRVGDSDSKVRVCRLEPSPNGRTRAATRRDVASESVNRDVIKHCVDLVVIPRRSHHRWTRVKDVKYTRDEV